MPTNISNGLLPNLLLFSMHLNRKSISLQINMAGHKGLPGRWPPLFPQIRSQVWSFNVDFFFYLTPMIFCYITQTPDKVHIQKCSRSKFRPKSWMNQSTPQLSCSSSLICILYLSAKHGCTISLNLSTTFQILVCLCHKLITSRHCKICVIQVAYGLYISLEDSWLW